MSVAQIAIQLPLRGFACFAFDFVSKRKLGIRGGPSSATRALLGKANFGKRRRNDKGRDKPGMRL